MQSVRLELREHIASLHPVNTHSHHYPDEHFLDFDLDKLIQSTYLASKWSDLDPGQTKESRSLFIKKAKFKSYYVYLSRALSRIYGIAEPLSADNWEKYDSRIRRAYADDPSHRLKLLRDTCGYERIILDAYWKPGDDNGYSGFFIPNFRIDYFVNAFSPDLEDHNGNTVKKLYSRTFEDIDEYGAFVRREVSSKLDRCCALKSTLAYEPYGIGFDIFASKADAAKALKAGEQAGPGEAAAFRGYIFGLICEEARKKGKPFQIHTGMGSLYKSNAIEMLPIINAYPDIKFSLFHASYPWYNDVAGLLHTCKNVYADLCWLPLLAPEASVSILKELIQISTSDKLCWGCDTITAEESYGALLAMADTFSRAFDELITEGYTSLNDAKDLLTWILSDNSNRLYGFTAPRDNATEIRKA